MSVPKGTPAGLSKYRQHRDRNHQAPQAVLHVPRRLAGWTEKNPV